MSSKRVVIFGWSQSVHVQRWVAGLTKRGWQIKVISLGGEPLENIETVCFPNYGKLSYYLHARSAAKEALSFKPDLIHVHYTGGFGIWGLKTKFKPLLASVWGADIIDLPNKWYYKKIVTNILNEANSITATSKFLKECAVKISTSVENKIKVVSFGVHIPDKFEPIDTSDPIKLCIIKGHRPKYGIDILLKALHEVKKVYPQIKLSLAGEGEMTNQLKEMTKELNLTDNVEFTGFIDNDNIYSFLKEHHAMVMPSVMDSESFGVAVLEASACGRPVIASDIGGVPEVLINNETGYLIPPKDIKALTDSILDIINNRDKINQMGQAGYNFAKEKYSWDKSLDKMDEIYQSLIDEAKN